ncbi:MAG: polymer-forming cytoskeletal protein [Acidobacteriota bacterium]|nr:polymer-forming cytoskeletal protein [Acidobacteriota bacterium]
MGWAWLERKQSESSEWTGFLEKGVRLEGKLETSGTLRIDSAMKGTLVSDGTLILGEHAQVEGEIVGNRVTILGHFTGTIRAKGRVEIHPKAIVSAEVHTPCLVIEPGSVFDGECHMVHTSDATKPVTIPIHTIAQAVTEPTAV